MQKLALSACSPRAAGENRACYHYRPPQTACPKSASASSSLKGNSPAEQQGRVVSSGLQRGRKASHVLIAIGLSHEIAQGSILFTFGLDSAGADIDYVLEVMPPIVERLRQMSPVYDKFLKAAKGGK
jgi:hypothetical protein